MSDSTLADVDELDGVISRNIRELLHQRGMRQSELAALMSAAGLQWTPNRVAQVVTGRRPVTLLELAVLCGGVFEVPLAQLLAGSDEISLPRGDTLSLDVLRMGLADGEGLAGQVQASKRLRDAYAEHEEATLKAARRLGVPREELDALARAAWGRSLPSERDRRLLSVKEPADSPRTIQARRGHITRSLLDELQAHKQAGRRGRRQGKGLS